jgi:hypothetical protein
MLRILPTAILLLLSLPLFSQINVPAWRADLAVVREQLPVRHRELFAQASRPDFERRLDAISAGLKPAMTDLDVALELQAALATLGDGQTQLDLTPLLKRERVIPIGFGFYSDGLYVSGTVRRFRPALGRRVVAINGLSVEQALDKVGRYIARETELNLRRDAVALLRYPAILRRAGLGSGDTLHLLLQDTTGLPGLVTVHSIDLQNADPADMQPVQLPRKNPDLRWQTVTFPYVIRWLPEDSLVYFQYNQALSREMALAYGDTVLASRLADFRPFADSLLHLLQQHPGARLFVDLRFNPGGMADDGRALADRLAQLPQFRKKDRLFVAVNLYTALSAVEIAEYFREKARATLIGDPPAQRPGHTGPLQLINLPGTGLAVRFAAVFPPRDKKTGDVLKIDVPVELPFEAFRSGRDPVLDYVRKIKP